MRKTLSLITLLFAALNAESQEVATINFQNGSWEETLQKAEKEQKYVFVYAFTKGCHFCRQMEKEVLPKKEVVDFYNASFINYKINIEDGAAGEALAKKYGIVGFPTYLYINGKGERAHQSSGAKPAEKFIHDGKNAFNPETALFSLKARYDQGDRTPLMLYNYSNALAFYQDADSPEEKVVNEYLATQSPAELKSEKNLRYIFDKYQAFQSPVTQYLIFNHEQFIPVVGRQEVNARMNRILTQTAGRAGEKNDTLLFSEVKKVIGSECANDNKLLALSEISYLGGRRNWLKYGATTLEYSKKYPEDWRTLYETAVYLKFFAKEKEELAIGEKLMEKVVAAERSYDNLYLYAQLQNKVGKKSLARDTAREAIKVAAQTGADSNDATEFMAELDAK